VRVQRAHSTLARRGLVPRVFFADSTAARHHPTGYTFDAADTRKLATQSRTPFRLTAAVAETTAPPPFRDPNPALATYADAVTVNRVFTLSLPDQSLFTPADQAALLQAQHDVAAVVPARPPALAPQHVRPLPTA